MRPLELRLRNFRSYHGEETVFDFRDRSLVGVVGPIGSGKSSLLDAVAFALYGKTPAGGSATKALIHQRTQDGGVKLRFEVEGEVWEVVRSLRRKGQSQHALYRYDDDHPDSAAIDKFVTEGEVNDKIKELLGLDFDAFGRSVLLAQGRFAEFLTAGPTQRDSVLKGVFGHDRLDAMRELAKAEAAERAVELATLAARAEQLEHTQRALADAQAQLALLDTRIERLRKLEPQLNDLDRRLADTVRSAEAAAAEIAELEPHGSSLPDEATTTHLIAEAAAIEVRRVRLAEELDAAKAAQSEAERSLAELRSGGEVAVLEEAASLFAGLTVLHRGRDEASARLADRRRRLDIQAVTYTRLAAEHAVAVGADETAGAALVEAETAMTDAATRHHLVQHQDMAATLRRELDEGDDCPVCLRPIEEMPQRVAAADLDAAQQAVGEAAARRRLAATARTDAAVRMAALDKEMRAADDARTLIEAEIAETGGRLKEAEAEIAEAEKRLGELLGPGETAAVIDQRRANLRAREAAAVETRGAAERLRSAQDQVIRDQQEVGKRVVALQRQVIELATRLGLEASVGDGEHAVLSEVVPMLRSSWSERIEEARRIRSAADTETAAITRERTTLLTAAEVTGSLEAALAADEARASHVGADVARHREEIEASAGLMARRTMLESAKTRYDRIARDLTDSRFVRFLLDDERSRLAELGSDHFMRLSSGRYRFTEDGKFDIVDLTAADAVRKAASLSGGETFLASLALALALAEMVTRGGGRLDAFFLDEGFGSLDPEHFDLAMEGIEALVADDANRLVVVVSHVSEMRERIEDLIELDRHSLTGDTRVVRA